MGQERFWFPVAVLRRPNLSTARKRNAGHHHAQRWRYRSVFDLLFIYLLIFSLFNNTNELNVDDSCSGQYQCFASNEWGTATSNSVFVRKSDLNSFKDEPPMTVSAQEGSPFSLRCQPPDGWPKPSVYWMMQNSNGALRSINSSRMTVDPEGTLWFSNVTREDTSDDFVYACSATSLFRYDSFPLAKLQLIRDL